MRLGISDLVKSRYAVDVTAQQLAEPDIPIAPRQGRQEVLTELLVGNPGAALFVFFKRQRVDPTGFPARY